MNFTREEFEAAAATIPRDAFMDYNWARRVSTLELIQERGAEVAYHLRNPEPIETARRVAPEFYDWFMAAFPPEGDAATKASLEECWRRWE
ncbi:MAG: hypothetical protein LC646_10910 [Xanthomonadaceae bacterium]|nr:hypothetical protein [Xanthomonadaceae bacterium]